MPDQWEYVILRGRWERVMKRIELTDDADVEYGPLNEETLNRLGLDGWEVCGYSESSTLTCTLILKRRIACEGEGRRDP
jgi:hypothetical protein